MRRLSSFLLTILVTITGLFGCGETVKYGWNDFMSDLGRAGATIELPPDSTVDQGLAIPSRRIVVNGANLYVHEFSNSLEAMKAARMVSPDGYNITRTEGATTIQRHSDWIEPPHFYLRGQLIVIYAGRDAGIKNLLTSLLSPQFAGSETNYRGQ